jgi:hypothetical protein
MGPSKSPSLLLGFWARAVTYLSGDWGEDLAANAVLQAPCSALVTTPLLRFETSYITMSRINLPTLLEEEQQL